MSFEINKLYNIDCMEFMKTLSNNSVDVIITDIPYGKVTRDSNGLTNFDRETADIVTFDTLAFVKECYRIAKSSITIFCGKEQFSEIHNFFNEEQKKKKGTVRQLVWEKCLIGSTKIPILNKDGIMKIMPITDIVKNNYKEYKVYTGEKWVPLISCKETTPVEEYIEITLRNNNKIKCTKEHRFSINNNLIHANELKIGDILDHCQISNNLDNIKEPKCLSKNILWFIGLFLGDGSLSGSTIQIAANIHANDERERLKEICNEVNCNLREYPQGANGTNYHIDSSILLAILKEYITGNTAYGKHFSAKCLNLSNDYLKEIFEGYLYADGHWEEKNHRWTLGFTKKNKELQNDLRFICNLLGYDIKLQETVTKAFNSEYETIRGAIRYKPSTHWNAKSPYEITKITLKQNNRSYKFYDLEIEDEPHLFSLSDGTLTHNTNPTPFNGQYVYLSGIENAVWFRKSKGTFNAKCKNTVFRYPIWGGKNRIHPTEKHHDLIKEIMLDNSNEGDLIFDPCAGSGSTLLVAKENGRKYLGCELDKEYYEKALGRLE